MSINIQTSNGLQKIISDNLTKSKVINALGYTPANANTLEVYVSQINSELAKKSEFSGSYYDLINAPDIIEDNSGSVHYADENGNVIATIDEQGVSSIEFYADGTPIKNTLNNHINDNKKHVSQSEKEYWNSKSDFDGDYNNLTNAPQITEDESGNIVYVDEQNNIIAKIDTNGFETTTVIADKFIADGQDIVEKINIHENNKNIHVSNSEKEYWNSKSEFDGNYENLTNAPDIQENENGEVIFADDKNNIIARLNNEGFQTTKISTNAILLDGNNLSTKLEQINTEISNTNTNLNSHISNTTPHIQPGERDKWNNKLDESQVSQMITAVIDSAPETLNTLNELAAALGDDPNFATTVATEIGKKTDKTDFSAHASDTNLHVVAGEKEFWNDKRYSSLTEAPHILEDESKEVIFADDQSNVIAKINEDGFTTTAVAANKVTVNGVDATTKFNELDAHVIDTIHHVTQEDKTAWNAKTTATQAGEIAAEAATKVKNELLDNVASDANTLNKLNTKISNVNTSLTTHTEQTDIHVNKSTIEGYATNATNAAVAIVCGNVSEDLNTLEKINAKIDSTTSTLNNAINNKANTTDLTAHTSKTDIHVSTVEKEAWNSKPTQEEASTIATNVTNTAINALINNAPSGSQTLKGLDDKINSAKNELSQNLSNHINDTVKHVTQAEKDNWDSKSTFSGDYDDLTNAPTIKDNDDGKVNFVDSNNYVIARIDKDGFQTTKVTTEAITLKDNDLKTTLDTMDTKISNHTDDKDIHVKPGERESWNSRTTVSQVSQMLAELVDSAPAELNTLNELAKALGDDPNFATTILGEVGKVNEALDTHEKTTNIHVTKTEIEGLAASATSTAISTVVGNIDENLNTLEKLNTDVTNRINEKLDSNLGTELKNKILVVNEQGDIETTDRLETLENKHEILKTDVDALITQVSTNKNNIEANKTSIGENAANIATNLQSITKLNSDVEDLNNEKVNKEDLAQWAKYEGTPQITIGVGGSYFKAATNQAIIYDGKATTTWQDGKMTSNDIVASTKLSTKEVAIDGGLSLKHVDGDGWYLM